MPETVYQNLQKPVARVFRRFSIKRRLDNSTGEYESAWFDISDDVKKWGKIGWSLDEKQYAFFQQGNVNMIAVNDRGQFNAEGNAGSYWSGYLTRYKTLARIEAGFLDEDGVEVPPAGATGEASTSSQFIGVITEPIELTDDNEAVISIKSLTSVLEDVPANLLAVASAGAAGAGQLTASGLMTRMQNVTDSSSNFILRKFITSTLWNIEATTNTLSALDTTTALDSYNCWTLAKKLAEASNKAVWITKIGGLNFKAQTPTTTVEFLFSGNPYNNSTYGHTIKTIRSMEEDYDYLYNRVRIKFGTADTSTAWKEKKETWVVGDSTTSWKYGVKTLEIQNTWMDSLTADNIASTLYVSLNKLTEKVTVDCKFIPTLNLLNYCQIDYDVISNDSVRWDFFLWANGGGASGIEANWDSSASPIYDFVSKFFKIIGLEHNIEQMETSVTMRSV
ncbi:MAG: hypothetical protein QME32_00325 [Endomicrobiia bacterium]|nr:hypothetical protein [Endomicrobiia bacterium]